MQQTEFVHLMIFVLKVPSFELVVTGTILSADSCFFEITAFTTMRFVLTFACWDEGLELSHCLCGQLRVQGHEPSATVSSVAPLQTVSKTEFKSYLARDVWLHKHYYKFKMELEMHNIAN